MKRKVRYVWAQSPNPTPGLSRLYKNGNAVGCWFEPAFKRWWYYQPNLGGWVWWAA